MRPLQTRFQGRRSRHHHSAFPHPWGLLCTEVTDNQLAVHDDALVIYNLPINRPSMAWLQGSCFYGFIVKV